MLDLNDAYAIAKYIKDAEKRLNTVILNIIRQEKGKKECPFGVMDYDVQINHSPTDNMQVKAQVLQMLLTSGIHPLVAIRVCGLWGDSEKVYLQSKPYLDVLYKTIDEVIKEKNLQLELDKANEIIKKINQNQNKVTEQ